MPRHPPCALKNLTITHNQHNQPQNKGPATSNDCVHTQNLRCSRPLCSSQTTTPVNTPPTPHNPKQTGSRHERLCPGKPETPANQTPTRNKPHNRATHPQQKPGPCCLRTQQCATHYRTSNQPALSQTTHPHPARTNPTRTDTCDPYSNQPAPTRHLFIDIPPMSTHRRTNACAMGILLTTPTPHTTQDANSCRRSLERR